MSSTCHFMPSPLDWTEAWVAGPVCTSPFIYLASQDFLCQKQTALPPLYWIKWCAIFELWQLKRVKKNSTVGLSDCNLPLFCFTASCIQLSVLSAAIKQHRVSSKLEEIVFIFYAWTAPMVLFFRLTVWFLKTFTTYSCDGQKLKHIIFFQFYIWNFCRNSKKSILIAVKTYLLPSLWFRILLV